MRWVLLVDARTSLSWPRAFDLYILSSYHLNHMHKASREHPRIWFYWELSLTSITLKKKFEFIRKLSATTNNFGFFGGKWRKTLVDSGEI